MKDLLKKVTQMPRDEVNEFLTQKIMQHERVNLVTANPEIMMHGSQDESIARFLLDESTLITPDGIGVVKGYNKLFSADIKRVTGVDTVSDMLKISSEQGFSLFVYGAKQEVLDKFKEILDVEYPGIVINELLNGYDNTFEDAIEAMKGYNSDLVLVALGVPRQERFMIEAATIQQGVFIGCGGSIDVLSGMIKRAPKLIMAMNLEWLYRIAFDPKRMKRFWNNQVVFMRKIYKLKSEEKQ